ncbi:MAG: hypothetical protein P8Y29_09615, partial [Gemmatimonadota bacterium]
MPARAAWVKQPGGVSFIRLADVDPDPYRWPGVHFYELIGDPLNGRSPDETAGDGHTVVARRHPGGG